MSITPSIASVMSHLFIRITRKMVKSNIWEADCTGLVLLVSQFTTMTCLLNSSTGMLFLSADDYSCFHSAAERLTADDVRK